MNKLLRNFYVIHTHGDNNFNNTKVLLPQMEEASEQGQDFNLPSVLEVTFVRKDVAQKRDCTSKANPELDVLVNPKKPEVVPSLPDTNDLLVESVAAAKAAGAAKKRPAAAAGKAAGQARGRGAAARKAKTKAAARPRTTAGRRPKGAASNPRKAALAALAARGIPARRLAGIPARPQSKAALAELATGAEAGADGSDDSTFLRRAGETDPSPADPPVADLSFVGTPL